MQENHQSRRQCHGNGRLHKPEGAGYIRCIRFLSVSQEHIVSGLLQVDSQGACAGGHGLARIWGGRGAVILERPPPGPRRLS